MAGEKQALERALWNGQPLLRRRRSDDFKVVDLLRGPGLGASRRRKQKQK
jgi:hypothetical protein